jgi:hypothetical protein
MKRTDIRTLATGLILGPTVLATLVGLGLIVIFADRLPDPLAVHWGIRGTVDRTDSLASVLVSSAIFAPLMAGVVIAVFLLMTRHSAATLFTRTLVGVGSGLGVLVGLLPFSFVLAQIDAPDAHSVPVSASVPGLIATLVIALAVGIGLSFVIPLSPVPYRVTDSAPALDLADGEKVHWSRSVWLGPLGLFIYAGAAVLVVGTVLLVGAPWWLVLTVLLVFALLATTLAWHVVVDSRGVHVIAALGFPRLVFDRADITGARSTTVSPMREFGGWGIRFGVSGSWGIIVRRGEALEISREHKAPFVITIKEAETAARLITGLTKSRA